MNIDDNARYAIFRKSDGKCAHCHTRLKWEEFDVRGRSGSWVLEVEEDEEGTPKGQALCFKCLEFPHRKTSGRLYTRTGFTRRAGEAEEKAEEKGEP